MPSRATISTRLRDRVRNLIGHGSGTAPFHLDEQDSAIWQSRAQDAVALWRRHRGRWVPERGSELIIADFGSGNERLRGILTAKLTQAFRYVPFDLHPQRGTTVRLDLAKEVPGTFDLVFCLGLLEYMDPDGSFVDRLQRITTFAIVSYVTAPSNAPSEIKNREEWGWRSHYTSEQLATRFSAAGFSCEGSCETAGAGQRVWLWRTSAAPTPRR